MYGCSPPFHAAMPTSLPDLLSARIRPAGASTVTFDIPEDWQQGRTTFGGLISTLAVQAMRDVAGAGWPDAVRLRALQTSFIGPVDRGPVQVSVQVLREGKNVRQIQALVQQAGQTAALLLGVFGVDRETAVPVASPPQPATRNTAADATQVPFMPGVSPNFLQHIEGRWSEGAVPFTGGDAWHSHIHLRLREGPIAPELLTVLLADVPPTPVLGRFTQRTPASSVSWELELRPVAQAPDPDAWWRVDTEVIAAAGGYVNQVSRLWTPAGELAALGYQVVAVYG